MRIYFSLTICALLFICLCQECIASIRWEIEESYFEGEENALRWKSQFSRKDLPDNFKKYDVTVCYGKSRLENYHEGRRDEILSVFKFSVTGKDRSEIIVTREELLSAEAIAHPPRKILYTILLQIDNRINIRKEHLLLERFNKLFKPGVPQYPEPDEETKKMLDAISAKNKDLIRESPIVKLAEFLLRTKKQLGPVEEKIYLKSCKVQINQETSDVTIKKDGYGDKLLHIRAMPGDIFTLYPEFYMRLFTPYLNNVDIRDMPLPSYALIKMSDKYGDIRVFGKVTGSPGKFSLGPVKVKKMRKMKLSASHPFEPGRERHFTTGILLRTGRLVEAFLDKGKLPPPLPVPGDLRYEDLISEVVRHAANAVNTDEDEVNGLDRKSLLDLYAVAFGTAKRYPDLIEILDEALSEEKAWQAYGMKKNELSQNKGWTAQDAIETLEQHLHADGLAGRILLQTEPLMMHYYTKEAPPELVELNTKTVFPHAFAMAALIKSDPEKYNSAIEQQSEHIMGLHNPENSSEWPLEEIIKTGQALKLVNHYAKNKKIKETSGEVVRILRHEAFQRLVKNNNLSLREKIEIAHLISDIWRPYLNVQPIFIPKAFSDGHMIQHMMPGPGGRDITGEALEETRLAYKSALEHAIQEMKKSNMPAAKKRIWMESFLDRWYKYLFNTHKGGYLQPYEEELQKDRIRAVKEIN